MRRICQTTVRQRVGQKQVAELIVNCRLRNRRNWQHCQSNAEGQQPNREYRETPTPG
jgi:hypothetical protein